MIIIWPMVQIARAQEAADILGQEQEFFQGAQLRRHKKTRSRQLSATRASFPQHPQDRL
jgi:hypothetical protein